MATPPVFVSGAILTAAQMNASALWLVKSQTIGNAVSSVQVTDAFTTDYDFYKIFVTGGAASATGRLRMTLGSTVTGYYYGLIASRFDNGGSVSVGGSNAALFDYMGQADSTNIDASIEVRNPFLTEKTFVSGVYVDMSVGLFTGAGPTNGILTDTTSYTSFTLSPASGTLTGGTISVYGYRKP